MIEQGLSTKRLERIAPAVTKYIGEQKMAGMVTLLARRGQIVHHAGHGLLDREQDTPMPPDALFRIYSMTKPIICTALMTLYEQNGFHLIDPVALYIPAFDDLEVYAGGDIDHMTLTSLARPVTIRDLLTHTSGLTYHFLTYGPVEALYRREHICSQKPLAEFVDDLLKMPLAVQPGTTYRYSLAHDVIARLIEVISGQPLDHYLRETLFEPLGMVDTGFYAPESKLDRLASMYGTGDVVEPEMHIERWYTDVVASASHRIAGSRDSLESAPHNVMRGGHGLVSTAMDYYRFAQMLLNHGELDGQRILGRKTVELMTTNHLLPGLLPYEIGGVYKSGYGYGLGLRVLMDVGQAQIPGSAGEFGWSGAASTYFWIDPQEQMVGVQMAQFQPNNFFPVADAFRIAAYQAVVD